MSPRSWQRSTPFSIFFSLNVTKYYSIIYFSSKNTLLNSMFLCSMLYNLQGFLSNEGQHIEFSHSSNKLVNCSYLNFFILTSMGMFYSHLRNSPNDLRNLRFRGWLSIQMGFQRNQRRLQMLAVWVSVSWKSYLFSAYYILYLQVNEWWMNFISSGLNVVSLSIESLVCFLIIFDTMLRLKPTL